MKHALFSQDQKNVLDTKREDKSPMCRKCHTPIVIGWCIKVMLRLSLRLVPRLCVEASPPSAESWICACLFAITSAADVWDTISWFSVLVLTPELIATHSSCCPAHQQLCWLAEAMNSRNHNRGTFHACLSRILRNFPCARNPNYFLFSPSILYFWLF